MGKSKLLSMSDEALLHFSKLSVANYEESCKEYYRRYALRINAYCRKIVSNQNDAEDLFQDTFMRFFNSIRQEIHTTNITAFLFKIARNLCIDHNRKQKQFVPLENIDVSYTDHSYEQDELHGLIIKSLDLVKQEHKEIFILREYQKLSYSDIAEIVGSTTPAVKSIVYRVKKNLRKILRPYIEELS